MCIRDRSISGHYRERPLAWHVAAWQAAGLTDVGTELMSLGLSLIHISEHYRQLPLAWHVAAWQAAGLTEVGTGLMSLGGGLVMWGRKGSAS